VRCEREKGRVSRRNGEISGPGVLLGHTTEYPARLSLRAPRWTISAIEKQPRMTPIPKKGYGGTEDGKRGIETGRVLFNLSLEVSRRLSLLPCSISRLTYETEHHSCKPKHSLLVISHLPRAHFKAPSSVAATHDLSAHMHMYQDCGAPRVVPCPSTSFLPSTSSHFWFLQPSLLSLNTTIRSSISVS
jgi:hypothetical protein